jgi:hypothetical protein
MHHVALTVPREEVARAIDAADDGNGIISQAEFRWTRRVPHPVLIGHAASLTPY